VNWRRGLRRAWDFEFFSWRTLGRVCGLVGLMAALLIAPSRDELVPPTITDFLANLGRPVTDDGLSAPATIYADIGVRNAELEADYRACLRSEPRSVCLPRMRERLR